MQACNASSHEEEAGWLTFMASLEDIESSTSAWYIPVFPWSCSTVAFFLPPPKLNNGPLSEEKQWISKLRQSQELGPSERYKIRQMWGEKRTMDSNKSSALWSKTLDSVDMQSKTQDLGRATVRGDEGETSMCIYIKVIEGDPQEWEDQLKACRKGRYSVYTVTRY